MAAECRCPVKGHVILRVFSLGLLLESEPRGVLQPVALNRQPSELSIFPCTAHRVNVRVLLGFAGGSFCETGFCQANVVCFHHLYIFLSVKIYIVLRHGRGILRPCFLYCKQGLAVLL